jgi:hypothetical protein
MPIRSFSLSPKRRSRPSTSSQQAPNGLRGLSLSPRRLPKPSCGDDGEKRSSDVAIIKDFVQKLNSHRSRDLCQSFTLHTKVTINDQEFDVADFLNVCSSSPQQLCVSFYQQQQKLTHYNQIVQQYSENFPDTVISVLDGAVEGPDFTVVIIDYDHQGKTKPPPGPLSDPFPYNGGGVSAGGGEEGQHEPEILQCRVEDGKLTKIHWRAAYKPNSKGMIRYVETTYGLKWTIF